MATERMLVLTAGSPHPRTGASAVLFYQYIASFRDAGFQILHAVLTERGQGAASVLSDYCREITKSGDVSVVECPMERMYRIDKFSRRMRSPNPPAILTAAVESFRPQVTVCFDIVCAGVVAAIGQTGTKIVWLGDLHFQTYWYNAIYDARESLRSFLRLPLDLYGSRQWLKYYKDALRDAATVIVSSKSSEGALARLGVKATYLPYPWPDVQQGGRTAPPPLPAKPTFLFFGTLSGLGSRSALSTFLGSVFPRMRKEWGQGGFQVYIAGSREMPVWARNAIEGRMELVFCGFVSNLEELARRCHATLVPIAVPVGNRSRILTAMSFGCLTIAHVNTALGNPGLVSGTNCLLARSGREFMQHLRFAVADPTGAAMIGMRARHFYCETFFPAKAVTAFLQQVRHAMELSEGGAA